MGDEKRGSKERRRITRDERDRQIARMVLAHKGVPYTEIARQLKVSASTVRLAMVRNEERWRAAIVRDVGELKATAAADIDEVRSQIERCTAALMKGLDAGLMTPSKAGALSSLFARALDTINAKTKLLGLDPKPSAEVTVSIGMTKLSLASNVVRLILEALPDLTDDQTDRLKATFAAWGKDENTQPTERPALCADPPKQPSRLMDLCAESAQVEATQASETNEGGTGE